jgi:hypothetical protein
MGVAGVSDPIADPVTEAAARSTSAIRMARHRDRRRKGLRCVTIELRESEVEVLVRRGWLSPDDRANTAAVKKGLYAFLDNFLQ